MNMAWAAEGGDVEQGTAGDNGADHSVPEDRSSDGLPLESLEASLQSSLTTSRTQRARRSAMLAFERELMHFSDQVRQDWERALTVQSQSKRPAVYACLLYNHAEHAPAGADHVSFWPVVNCCCRVATPVLTRRCRSVIHSCSRNSRGFATGVPWWL